MTMQEKIDELVREACESYRATREFIVKELIVREAAIIVDSMGLLFVHKLEVGDLIDMWDMGEAKGLTGGISKDYEKGFKVADLVVAARSRDGTWCYVAVEIAHTVDERDTTRAARNAGYISSFTGVPAYVAVAGVCRASRIEQVLTDVPQPHDDEGESGVFWSRHESLADLR